MDDESTNRRARQWDVLFFPFGAFCFGVVRTEQLFCFCLLFPFGAFCLETLGLVVSPLVHVALELLGLNNFLPT